ncbi:nickel pincer cofactor biosynthesis protein LarB [Fusibacter ferrireducens]|uniref:Nickel pincer cofactor biosynthesis protein LarB n=1 Tax=Fusibacter ferrireducens TaxID=2785058 RepID=A0ABR9ZYQ6_9FIRM|nr:nickel pincer cofactor biosynthesis protein LarB [Fusibacter ferrireducens]MBF4694714.1 nickel pincer cofactor biosynthesis protein LarB [Fusibacter ferrireducens]
MGDQFIEDILNKLQNGEITREKALLKLKKQPFEDIGFAKIDHHRKLRQGYPEVIYGAGKTVEQIIEIISVMINNQEKVILITRIGQEVADQIREKYQIQYDPMSRIGIIGAFQSNRGHGSIVVVSGGTSDMPVAEEAAITAEAFGNHVIRLYDVGVAGLHRLLAHLDEIMSAKVIIAVAGMEGAIASVVGGLVDCPVIAVPTSVGYGASFNGLAALLSMLNSCASGVCVVNIDNGFGAGYTASMINQR